MKSVAVVLSVLVAMSAHAENPQRQAESHLQLAKAWTMQIAHAERARANAQLNSQTAPLNQQQEAQAFDNLVAMRAILRKDFASVEKENSDLRARLANVIRQIDSITTGRDGVMPPAAGLSRNRVR